MKQRSKIVASALCAVLALGAVGCGKNKVRNDDNTLEIFICDAGYGTQWLTNMIAAFKEQAWVQEKYPNLNIPDPEKNTLSDYSASKMIMGSDNTTDLFFSCNPEGVHYGKKGSNGETYYKDLYDVVYNTTVPGEDILVKDKMDANMFNSQKAYLATGDYGYFAFPWVTTTMGLYYNSSKFVRLLGEDYQVPRTTDELLKCCEDLKAVLPEDDAPFLFTQSSRYWNGAFLTWWAQYEGLDNYINYWNGIDSDGQYTKKIIEYPGRYEAWEVLENLISRDKGNNHSLCTTGTFFESETKFFLGSAGVFSPNGDWVLNEMSEAGGTDVIDVLRMPVVSSIVEKCTSVNTDAQLAFVIDQVDARADYATAKAAYATAGHGSLAEADYTKLTQARNMVNRKSGHDAFVPSYATGREIAYDFLRFMATDIGIEVMIKAGNGYMVPYNYTPSETLTEQMHPHFKTFWDRMDTTVLIPSFLP